jgi:hypothetical protein
MRKSLHLLPIGVKPTDLESLALPFGSAQRDDCISIGSRG